MVPVTVKRICQPSHSCSFPFPMSARSGSHGSLDAIQTGFETQPIITSVYLEPKELLKNISRYKRDPICGRACTRNNSGKTKQHKMYGPPQCTKTNNLLSEFLAHNLKLTDTILPRPQGSFCGGTHKDSDVFSQISELTLCSPRNAAHSHLHTTFVVAIILNLEVFLQPSKNKRRSVTERLRLQHDSCVQYFEQLYCRAMLEDLAQSRNP